MQTLAMVDFLFFAVCFLFDVAYETGNSNININGSSTYAHTGQELLT